MAASWEASGGSLFAALRAVGVSGISGAVAAGLGAAFGTTAVVLTALFKKKTETTHKESEPINEKPMEATVRAPAPTESVKLYKKPVEEPTVVEKQVDETISVKKLADVDALKTAKIALQSSEAVAEIISIPVTKAPQEELVPIQSEVHFEAVQSIENQIVEAVSNAVKEEEELVEEEEEEEESDDEAIVLYPSKPTTFSEQILAAREVADSVSLTSSTVSEKPISEAPVRDLEVEEEEEEEDEEEEEEIVVKIAAKSEASVPNHQDETTPKKVDNKAEVIADFVAKTAEKVQVTPIQTKQDDEEEEWEEEEEEEDVVVKKQAVDVAKTSQAEEKIKGESEEEESEEEESEENIKAVPSSSTQPDIKTTELVKTNITSATQKDETEEFSWEATDE